MSNQTPLSFFTPQSAHPETGPGNRGTSVDMVAGIITGAIVFNRPPTPTEDPRTVIARAIASGDTTKKRLQLLQKAVLTPSSDKL